MVQLNSDSYRNPLRYQGQDYAFVPLYYRQRDPTTTDTKPKEQNGHYLIGSEWINTVSGDYWYLSSFSTVANVLQANWVLFGGATGYLLTLSDSLGTVVDPTAQGNIQLIGVLNEQTGSGASTFYTTLSNFAGNFISFNPMSSSRWIVDPLSTFPNPNGTHTTIASALTSARSGDTIFILPGTYTENITLKAGVAIAAYQCDGYTGITKILGTVTASYTGTATLSGIQFITNGATAFNVTGASCTLNLIDCNIVANDSTAITLNSASAQVNVDQCIGGNAGNNPFFVITLGTLEISDSFIGNSSNSATAICTNAGTFNCFTTHFDFPVTTSGTGSVNYYFSRLHTAGSNTIALTLVGTGGATIENCVLQTGGAEAVTVGAGCNCNFQNNVVDSTATPNAITGAGSINYANNSFVNTAIISTTTQSANTLRYGIARSTKQPVFAYYANAQNNVVGLTGTVYTVQFANLIVDQASNFSANTTFTAPVTGNYQFNVAITIQPVIATNSDVIVNLVTTGATYQLSSVSPAKAFETLTTLDSFTITGSVLTTMTATDTAIVTVEVGGAANNVNIFNDVNSRKTYFSGFLIC